MTFNLTSAIYTLQTGCGDLTLSLTCDSPEKFPMQIGCGIVQFSVVQCKALFTLLQLHCRIPIQPSLLIFDVEDLSVSRRAQSYTSENDWGEVYSSLLQNTHIRTHTPTEENTHSDTPPHPIITTPQKHSRHFLAGY